jgi:hypothetical protein
VVRGQVVEFNLSGISLARAAHYALKSITKQATDNTMHDTASTIYDSATRQASLPRIHDLQWNADGPRH